MTYAEAYAQADHEWSEMDLWQQIAATEADDEGISGYLRYLHDLRSLGRSEYGSVRDYLRTRPACIAWLDRRAVQIQDAAHGRDDHDAAHDYAKENP